MASAVVIGCTNEMLDTSYEKVQKEAQLNTDHPMVFSAYVGNGMAGTRSLLDDNTELITETSHLQSSYFGVYAYNTKGKTFNEVFNKDATWSDVTSASGDIYTSLDKWQYKNGSQVYSFLMNNTKMEYSDSKWKPKDGYDLYWPRYTDNSGNKQDAKVTFFAYYPYTDNNGGAGDWSSSAYTQAYRILEAGQVGLPVIEYRLPTDGNGIKTVDLMVATPVVDKTATTEDVEFEFKHILAAVSVKLAIQDPDAVPATGLPVLYCTKASIQGTHNGDIDENSVFRRQGRFSPVEGIWYQYAEPYDLMAESWLNETHKLHIDYTATSGSYQVSNLLKSQKQFDDTVAEGNEWGDFNRDGDPASEGYMFIMPGNSSQNGLKLSFEFVETYGSGLDKVEQPIYFEKTLENVKIEAGKYYQILLKLDRSQQGKPITFTATVENWAAASGNGNDYTNDL